MDTLRKQCEVHCKLSPENLNGTTQVKDLRAEGRIILKRTKVERTGFIRHKKSVKQLGLMNSAMKLRVPLEARNLLNGPATATFSIKALSCGAGGCSTGYKS